MSRIKRPFCIFLCILFLLVPVVEVHAEPEVSAPSVVLMEASTGQIIYEKNADQRRSPASITKIMTLLLTFEGLKAGKIHLEDQVVTSAHAGSMGGSQVFLEEGESQSLETMIKCIAVASANDASVAVAEHIAGSETAFVELMNERAKELGMADTHFVDCCGLTDDEDHYSCARDVALMSRELITGYPEVYAYTKIWMEDITHNTRRGSTLFTLSSTNKLLKQYEWTTGLKTGSTSKAKYCISATAHKDGMDLIAVVMGAPDPKNRFRDARTLLQYGYNVARLFTDENREELPPLAVKGGVEEWVSITCKGPFHYLDLQGSPQDELQKELVLPETVTAPLVKGEQAGEAVYYLGEKEVGRVPILFAVDVPRAKYGDCLKKIFLRYLVQI